MRADDPFRDLREPVRTAAATVSPPTGAEVDRRLRRRRAARAAAASVVVLVVVAGGVGLAGRAPDQGVTAAGLPPEGHGGTLDRGTVPGTVPGSAVPAPVPAPSPDDPEVASPTTTTIEVDPAPSVPPTTAMFDESTSWLVFTGSYEGVGHYAIDSPTCPDITQDLDLTMTVDDGSVWTLHADYCAATDANGWWRGEGPFTITTSGNDTLVGNFVSVAHLPTGGVPFDLMITGGTGRFDGVEGACSVTVALEDIDFGVQRNTGTFECSVLT